MLNLGMIRGRTCGGASRRAFLRVGTLGALGLTLGDYLALRALGGDGAPPARAVIMLWLWGGPSHLDTFDMKPDAPVEYRGPFDSIATTVPGLRICELLPGLARRADRFALLRGMHHESNDHGIAGTIALTGTIAGAVGLGGAENNQAMRPSTGAIVGRLRQGKPGSLPPYIILGNPLHQGLKRVVGEGGGSLGSTYDPFRLEYEPGVGLKLPDVTLPDGVSAARLGARWDLLQGLDQPARNGDAAVTVPPERLKRHYELARNLIASGQSLAALDAAREPRRLREAYGAHRFGQSCLIARRLVESGIPFVQVNWSTHVEGPEDAGDGGWDMHDRYFQIMQDRHGWMFDRALSALLDDLHDRGLLDTTLVVAVGEFGRTPKINDRAGRDHWNNCYSALVAGGGVQGGRVIGASDRRGEHPRDRPVTPADLGTTILARLGIDTTALTGVGLTPMGSVIEDLF
ncbi:phosphoglycerol transferase family protein, alkaline phosphatase superfamily [Singulisphaera acidiphila DSM 18658]|uniref:Phosphoglycerol transferase family protein, alkaline phosphatase superfamily n=2 Tax=Singulisphaera acidiphila TaxID=466153 RepID=L0DPL0_SINAD|nr:phosphoglycerol transferase family protein, alkaline phosphatase superfamily [Singulisphaera acidiphila DSM 18658]